MVAIAGKKPRVEHLVSGMLMVTVAARDGHFEAIVTPTHSSASVGPTGTGFAEGHSAAGALLRAALFFLEDAGVASPAECEALRLAITHAED